MLLTRKIPSSITKNFVISGQEQVDKFIKAIEESAQNPAVRKPVAAKFVDSNEELIELLEKWEKIKGDRRTTRSCATIETSLKYMKL